MPFFSITLCLTAAPVATLALMGIFGLIAPGPAVTAITVTIVSTIAFTVLWARDLAGSDTLQLTQEFLAQMLGVRRTSVSLVANTLQNAGLIRYRRGHVTILDHEALQQRTCECYDISKREFDRMLGDTAVAVHPDDPRWNWAIGKHIRLPLTDRLIPIIADAILVDPKFGTGVVK